MQSVDLKAVLTGVRPGGSVQPYLESFAAELISAGYSLLSARDYMRSAAHLGRWMDSCNVRIGRLKKATLTRFARHKCECPGIAKHGQRPSRRTVARARQFLEHLVRLGVVPPLRTALARPLSSPLVGFRAWMMHHRGVKARTVERYERLIEQILPALGSNPAAYDAALVRQALLPTVK